MQFLCILQYFLKNEVTFLAIFSLSIVVPEHKIEEGFKLAIGQGNGVRSIGKMPYHLGHTCYAHFDGTKLTQRQILVPVLTVSTL